MATISKNPNQSTVFTNLAEEIRNGVENALVEVGQAVCEEMKTSLIDNGHEGTGELLDSIGYEMIDEGNTKSVVVHMSAYGKFIDSGTGAAHGVEGGRVGSWRYQDRAGNWHTTDGMDADPFIEPAAKEVQEDVPQILSGHISDAIDERGKSGG